MLTHLLNLARNATRKLSEPASRSPEWPKIEHAHLKLFPVCASCGSDKRLQVHHMRPFHLHPELELDPSNLITLCMSPNDCHILIGHGDDFKAYNPNVQADATKVKANTQMLKEVAAQAKANRLYE